MSKMFSTLVYDSVVQGTAAVYSDPLHDAALGAADALFVQVVVDQANVASVVTSVFTEHSADRLYWMQHEAVVSGSTPNNATTNLWGQDTEEEPPRMGFTRFRISLAASETPKARVRLYVTGRGY